MEPATMIRTALALLTVAALAGAVMVVLRFARGTNPPSSIAMGHGLLAGAGLTLLIYARFTVGLPALASWSLLLLVASAAGGVYVNLAYHDKDIPIPAGITIGHAVIAVAGYLLLAGAVALPA
jgi:hypothetical protein